MFEELPAETERVGKIVVDSAYKVHSALGPGLLESVYHICLAHELENRGLQVELEAAIEVVYDGVRFPAAFRIDLLVENTVVVEIKSVELEQPVCFAQLLTYLKLSHRKLGFLINFNTPLLKDGLKRFIQTH